MSAKTKFAPGPWHVIWPMAAGLGMSRPGIDAGNQTIIEAGAEDDDCGVFGYTPQECDANARLIAAAPDLAEALAALTDWHEWSLEQSERAADEFKRETGFLAPFKDSAAMAGLPDIDARAAWRAWYANKNAALIESARAALKRAGVE